MTNIPIRCSSLPLLAKCPAPVRVDGPTIDGATIAAEIGTAIHEVFGRAVSDHPVPDEPFAAFDFTDAERDEATALLYASLKVWRNNIAPLFPIGVEVERYYDWPNDEAGVDLTGHVDIGGWIDSGIREYGVVDLKSGRVEDADQLEQLIGYAYLAMQHHGASTVVAIVFYIRSGNYTRRTFTREQLEDWYDRRVKNIASGALKYSTGPHCAYCPKFHSCPAQQAMTRNIVRTFIADHPDMDRLEQRLAAWNEGVGVEVDQLLGDIGVVEKAIDGARGVIRNMLAAKGPLPIPDDRVLKLTEQVRVDIEARAAWPVLKDNLDEDDLARVLSVSKGRLESRVKAKAGPGDKKAQFERIMLLLKDAGATSERTVMVTNRVKDPQAAAELKASKAPAKKTTKKTAKKRGKKAASE